MTALPDGYLFFFTVRDGASVMPGYGYGMMDHEVWSLVAYLPDDGRHRLHGTSGGGRMSHGPDLTKVIERAPHSAPSEAIPLALGAIAAGVAGGFLASGHGTERCPRSTSSRTPCSGWALLRAASCSPSH